MAPATFRILVTVVAWLGAGQAAAQEVMTIRAIQQAATAEPFEEVAVKAEGTVTWADPTAEKVFYMQDATGGVRVSFTGEAWPEVGAVVVVDGMLARGAFAPVIERAAFVATGRSELPHPMRASGGGLLNGAFNGERVDVDGWVRAAEMTTPTTLSIVLISGTSRITVKVSDAAGSDPERMVANHLRAYGVATPVKARGAIRQLVEVQVLVVSPRDLIFSHRERIEPKDLPVLTLQGATQYRPGQTRGDRMRVRGRVIHRRHGVAYLHDGASGLAVRGPEADALVPGTWVEAVGFLDMEEFLPVLSDAIFRESDAPGPPVEPQAVEPGALLDGLQHANFVRVRGRLLDGMLAPAGGGSRKLVLALQSQRGVFTAELEPAAAKLPPRVEPEATLEIEGVALVQTDAAGNPSAFKILVPGPENIEVVRRAGFFTVKRLLVLLSVTLAVLLCLISLAYLLARRNARLRTEMHERRAIAAERSRLARDLHDTLEQGLTGIHLQLHSIGPSVEEAAPETQDRLAQIRSLVQQCHGEMRRSIWNLRASALERFDLGEALQRSARSLVLGSPVEVRLRQTRAPGVSIPPLVEDNLLRIGQEALTNAIKHAAPSRIDIELDVAAGRLSLSIRDDGRGLPESVPDGGHFGLGGMRERAARIGGRLEIDSTPGAGCCVSVEVPLPEST